MTTTLKRDTKFLVAIYVLLFAWSVIRTVYQDHRYLVGVTRQRRSSRSTVGLFATATHHLMMRSG